MKLLLIIAGTISLTLGILGMFLPILPTTPFLLLSAACYVRSSKELYLWLINHKYLGSYIKDYNERRAIPLRAKIISITTLWISISYAAIFKVPFLIGKATLIIIALLVTRHLLSLKTI